MNIRRTVQLIFISIIFASCATKVPITYVEPSKAKKNVKAVAVLSISKDGKIGLRDKVEGAVSAHTLNGEPYFTVVERLGVEKILNENLGSKWSETMAFGEQLGTKVQAEAVVLGAVSDFGSSDSQFTEKRTKCEGNGDNRICHEYTVNCQRRTYSLDATLKLVDVNAGAILYGNSYSPRTAHEHCSDENGSIPGTMDVLQQLSQDVATEFVSDIAPEQKTMKVTLLDSLDVEADDKQKAEFKKAIEYFKLSRLDRASELLNKLGGELANSYVLNYLQGLISEAGGEYALALSYYKNSDRLTEKPDKVVTEAVARIEQRITEQKKIKQQEKI